MIPILLLLLLVSILAYHSLSSTRTCTEETVEPYEEELVNPVLAYVQAPHAGGKTSQFVLLENPPYMVKTI